MPRAEQGAASEHMVLYVCRERPRNLPSYAALATEEQRRLVEATLRPPGRRGGRILDPR